ncbi:hypothetical protein ACG0Z4_01515 [Enterocloster aldenensis]
MNEWLGDEVDFGGYARRGGQAGRGRVGRPVPEAAASKALTA